MKTPATHQPVILIVDDHADIRALVRMTLELEAFEIHEAGSGSQALTLLQTLRPRLLLLDVMMAPPDGLALCAQVRADPAQRGCRIVLLSARGQDKDKAAGLAAGADAYLVKPFSPMALLELVRRLCDAR